MWCEGAAAGTTPAGEEAGFISFRAELNTAEPVKSLKNCTSPHTWPVICRHFTETQSLTHKLAASPPLTGGNLERQRGEKDRHMLHGLETVSKNMRELKNLLGQFSEDGGDLWMRRCSRNVPK